ncbi:hypothetical protein D3C74_460920 [compost metagenome]
MVPGAVGCGVSVAATAAAVLSPRTRGRASAVAVARTKRAGLGLWFIGLFLESRFRACLQQAGLLKPTVHYLTRIGHLVAINCLPEGIASQFKG